MGLAAVDADHCSSILGLSGTMGSTMQVHQCHTNQFGRKTLKGQSFGQFTRLAWRFVGFNLQALIQLVLVTNVHSRAAARFQHFNPVTTLTLYSRTSKHNVFYNALLGD
jgi:hypothetical protein